MAVFVTGGNQRATLAVVRPLGRAGIPVVVGETAERSLASSSRYCSGSVVYPSPSTDEKSSHLPGRNFYSCLAGRLTGCKAVCTYHGEIELAGAGSPRGAFKLWFVRHNAAAITVVADALQQRLLALSMPAQKMVRIYNGIDVAVFLERLLADRALATELARNARALVETRYSLQQMLNQYQLLYERCLTRPAPA